VSVTVKQLPDCKATVYELPAGLLGTLWQWRCSCGANGFGVFTRRSQAVKSAELHVVRRKAANE